MNKTILLKAPTHGTAFRMESIDFPEGGGSNLDFFYSTIGCEFVDIVPAYALERDYNMKGFDLVVDDEGLILGKPINPLASFLYGYLEHGQPLCGDVLVCKRVETPEGYITGGLEMSDLVDVASAMDKLVRKHNKRVGGKKP